MNIVYLWGPAIVLGFAYFLFIVARSETGIIKYVGYGVSGLLVVLLPLTPILYAFGAIKIPGFLS